MVGDIVIVLTISFVVSLLSLPIIIKYSRKNGLYDYIDERKIHDRNISRLGGLAIFLGFTFAFVYIYITDFNVNFNVYLFMAAILLIFLTGFIDDLFNISAKKKLLLQIISALLITFAGLKITEIMILPGIKIHFGFFSYIVTVIWIIAFVNAINLLDGMDGLASGIVVLAAIFMVIIGFIQNNFAVIILSIALIGADIAFLLFNFPPAKIFMGDGGAYFLGFVFSVIPLMGLKKSSTVVIFLIPIVLLFIPLLDMARVVKNRFKGGYHIFIADKNHIHHKLLNLGFTNKGILLILYAYTILLGCFAVLMKFIPSHFSLILLMLLTIFIILSFYTISMAETKIEKLESIVEEKNRNNK